MGKRILFISPTGTLDNGAERSITNLMVHLVNLGYTIFNIYPENGHPTHIEYVKKLQTAGVRLYPLNTLKWWWEEAPGERLFSKEERLVFYQKNIKEIRDLIREHQIELVISNTANVFQGSIAAACEDIPHFWLIHEFPEREFEYYADKINYIFDNSDKVFAVQGNLVKKLGEANTYPSNLQAFVPYTQISSDDLLPSNQRRIVSIGVINENKNQIELLKAYQKLGRYDIPLVFIGDWQEDCKQECDEFIEKYALTQVQFLGYKENPWKEVTDSDICVYTSKSEAFPLVFIEAILKGVPTVVSDNYGYTSVKDYFDAGVSYKLGKIDSLVEKMSHLLEHFQEYKSEALLRSEKAKELYTLDSCYENIITSIGSAPKKSEKSLRALKVLLGETVPKHTILDVKEQFVTVYYAKAEEEFSEVNSLKFPLQYSDELYFRVPKDTTSLRIDLSEIPAYYENVHLKSYRNHTELKISSTNGLILPQGLLFGQNDPQLHYRIDSISDLEFIFSYKMRDIFEPMKEGSVLTELVNAERVKIQLQEELLKWKLDYETVVNSKRWQISSKVINFFRRKK